MVKAHPSRHDYQKTTGIVSTWMCRDLGAPPRVDHETTASEAKRTRTFRLRRPTSPVVWTIGVRKESIQCARFYSPNRAYGGDNILKL